MRNPTRDARRLPPVSFYSTDELKKLGLSSFGEDVRISRKTSIYNAGRITVGNHVRIDDFCVISAGEGGIEIGDYVHISVYCFLVGAGKITLHDYSSLSNRVTILSSSDDFSGEYMINPTIPEEFTNVISKPVSIGTHVVVGSGSIIMPGVSLEYGSAIGALSLVNGRCNAFGIYAGIPARRVKQREGGIVKLGKKLRQQETTRS